MKKLIITESEKKNIIESHSLINESILDSIINQIKKTKIYQKVEKVYDPNPATFVNNVLPIFPKVQQLKDKLLSTITDISKMSKDEKENYIKKNSSEVLTNMTKLNEQIAFGVAFLTLIFIGIIYIIIGISKSDSPQERDRKLAIQQQKDNEQVEKDNLEKQQRLEAEKLKYKEQNDILESNFMSKTLNLYDDSAEQTLNSNFSPLTIKGIKFKQINSSLKGVVITGNSPESFEGILGGTLVAVCKANPDEFSNVMMVYTPIGERKSNVFYNKAFTSKLNQIGKQWCIKPKADFGLRQSNSNISRTV
jgi:hypothetical protein